MLQHPHSLVALLEESGVTTPNAQVAATDRVARATAFAEVNGPMVLAEVLARVPGALREPADSGVDLVRRSWCQPDDDQEVHFATHADVGRELDRRGLEIPFPRRDVHLHQAA